MIIAAWEGVRDALAHVAEHRLALLLARQGGLFEVVGQHPDEKLTDAFELHVLGEAGGVQAGPQRALGEFDAWTAPADDALSLLVTPLEQFLAGHDVRDQPDPLRLRRIDIAAGEHDLR